MTPRIRTVLFAGTIAVLLLTALVPSAQAARVHWELTDLDHPGEPGQGRLMDALNHNASGETPVDIDDPVLWLSNAVATHHLNITGSWTFGLRFTGVSSTLLTTATVTAELGTWRDGVFNVQHSREIELEDTLLGDVFRSPGSSGPTIISVVPGDRIGLRLQVTTGEATLLVGSNGDATPSFLRTPDADDNFPVPELGSIILLAAGLVAVAGVVYVKKRQA